MAQGYRRGHVFVQNCIAGIIEETDEGYVFTYTSEYLGKKDAYASTVLFLFFDGLIPEGWLLGIVNRNWKIDPQDRFGLLLAVCRDCIGDVYVKSEGNV